MPSQVKKRQTRQPGLVLRIERIRKDYGIAHPLWAQLLGVDTAILDAWISANRVPGKYHGRLKKLQTTLAGLGRVMRKEFIPTWLTQPNQACRSAGGRTPADLLAREQYDKIEAMIYFLESGTPY
jgi:hypothetical protein